MALFKKKTKEPTEEDIENGQPVVTKQDEKERKAEVTKELVKDDREKPADLAYVSLRHVDKVYENGVQAVYDFTLDVQKHEFIVLVGPSGCGKSTTLRMIAGLEDITNGELYIDGEYANDKSPKDRDIAMVFQSYALYPHMTVYNNMAFGLKIRHLPKAEIDRRVHEAAKILQIEEYLDRKPKALSGGQRQRVALGRAIVRNAKVFLMDEPLSNLDAKLRVQMRSEIIKLHEALNATTIYVTHDQTEAMTMATRIVVMKAGHIQQIGTPIEIYNNPANLFVAGFIGSPSMNFLKAVYDNGSVILSGGERIVCHEAAKVAHDSFYKKEIASAQQELASLSKAHEAKPNQHFAEEAAKLNERIAQAKLALAGPHQVVFGIRPEDIHEADSDHTEDALAYDIRIAVAELLGHEYYIHADFGGIDLIAKVPLVHEIRIGDRMKIVFANEKAHLFDTLTEKRIV
jgi:multiple sugar transport system ATP-binding protein